MTVSAGEIQYQCGHAPCMGVGLLWTDEDLDAALDESVATVLLDDEGKAGIGDIFKCLPETGFARERLRHVLDDPEDVENWRVGEAIAETYLSDHRSCDFPWPDGRDERKRGSSLPGADLVGFGKDKNGDCLAFGEVKTSSDEQCPPNVMYGRTGLKRQLESLRDQETIRDDLFKYLAHRATTAAWRPRFESAGRRYLRNTSDVQLYGVLIRDISPNQDDLRVRVRELARDCPNDTRIELLSLYLPVGRISGIGNAVIRKRKGAKA